MPNFRPLPRIAWLSLGLFCLTGTVSAQVGAQGFAVDRFNPSAPGAGFWTLDDLRIDDRLAGAIGFHFDYARTPLRIIAEDGSPLRVVSDQAFADLSVAVIFRRVRGFLGLPTPIMGGGQDGMALGTNFPAPRVDLGRRPDSLSDVRFGLNARLWGDLGAPLRLGAGAEVWLPTGSIADYDSDGTVRALGQVQAAGDLGRLRYAGSLGFHRRPRKDWAVGEGPWGDELVFGAGAQWWEGLAPRWTGSVGAELFGQSALAALFQRNRTGNELLLTGRLEHAGEDRRIGIQAAVGVGIIPHFGTPDLRAVIGVEAR